MALRFPRLSVRRWLIALAVLLPAGFVLAVNLWISFPPRAPVPDVELAVTYFAYGSNMNERYFTRVRGITRVSSEVATLPGYAVQFNLDGIAVLEPSFANLAPDLNAVAYGVVHQLPEGEFSKIVGSEGDHYNVRDVEVFLSDGSTVIAKTLISEPSLSQPVIPSRRYLEYLHEAAKTHNFPPELIQAYNPDQGVYFPVVSEAFGAAIQTVVWITARL